MNLIEAREILEKALDLDIPLMLWGPPGVGKSTLVAETAGKRKLPVCDLRYSAGAAAASGLLMARPATAAATARRAPSWSSPASPAAALPPWKLWPRPPPAAIDARDWRA